MDIGTLLETAGLGQYAPSFAADEIDLDGFVLMRESDLVDLSVDPADRPAMLHIVEQLKGRAAPQHASANASLLSEMAALGLGRDVSQVAISAKDAELEADFDMCFAHGGDVDSFAVAMEHKPPTTEESAKIEAPPMAPELQQKQHQRSATAWVATPGDGPASSEMSWAAVSGAAAALQSGEKSLGGGSALHANSVTWSTRSSGGGWHEPGSKKSAKPPGTPAPVSASAHLAAVDAFVRSCGLSDSRGAHDATEPAPQHSTLVVILRGVPGCGKSTLTKTLERATAATGRRVVICSADKVRCPCMLEELHRFGVGCISCLGHT